MTDASPVPESSVSGIEPANAEQTYPYEHWPGVIPWPPAALMYSVGAKTLENFSVVGDAWNQVLARRLPRPGSQVLDIGCGCGRVARLLATNPYVARYVGFDVVVENVDWCRRFIVPHTGDRFEFHHFDVYSGEYNPRGVLRGVDLLFPAPDGSTQLVFATSVFTHLLEPDAVHYLEETRRVLAADGIAVFSIHDDATAAEPFRGSERKIDVHPPYWRELAARRGLVVREHYGQLCGQDTYVLARA